MGVGAESHRGTATLGLDELPPIEIESTGIGVELHGGMDSSRLLDHGVYVDRVRLAGEQESTGRVRENSQKGIIEGAKHALGHRRAAHAESRVDRSDDEIEAREELVVVVEAAVGENVGLDAFENMEAATGQLVVQRVDFLELSEHFLA